LQLSHAASYCDGLNTTIFLPASSHADENGTSHVTYGIQHGYVTNNIMARTVH